MICSQCLLSDDIECVELNDIGVCNYCTRYDHSKVKLLASHADLEDILIGIKKRNRRKQYDVIAGISGGVDSCYVLYQAVKKLGLRVLALHIDTGWNSEVATRNIKRAVSILGVDLHTHVVFWPSMRNVQRAFFKAGVVNCDIPQDHMFKVVQADVCKKFGINDFVSGRHFLTDGMMPASWVFNNSDGWHIRSICKSMGEEMLGYKTSNLITSKIKKKALLFRDHRLLEYEHYNRETAKELLTKELDWTDYHGKHFESVYTEYYQSYYLYERFNIDKRVPHFSGQIKNGEIRRNIAKQKLCEKPYSPERIRDIEPFFISKLGFSKFEWEKIMKQATQKHEFYGNQVALSNRLSKLRRAIYDLGNNGLFR